MTSDIAQEHYDNAKKAKELYIVSRNPTEGANDWHAKLREARGHIAAALRASNYLRDVQKALEENGGHMAVFRHFLAPPTSQDQFQLLCDGWQKTKEKNFVPLSQKKAAEAANAFMRWKDPAIGRWLLDGRAPTHAELRSVLERIAPLMAYQGLATWKRNLAANRQEQEVVELLISRGWTKLPSSLIDTRAEVSKKHFMHKTRFATRTTAPQEVDIACGLGGTYVLAMECKVTNDATNSVKRVNDILKKAVAWKEHWGSFVETAALLQGVIAAKDVQRLTDNGVLVFWSHDLQAFAEWLETKT